MAQFEHFASSPALLAKATQLQPVDTQGRGKIATHVVTSNGLSITLPYIPVGQSRVVAILNCIIPNGACVGI
jgi:hypothetical protein